MFIAQSATEFRECNGTVRSWRAHRQLFRDSQGADETVAMLAKVRASLGGPTSSRLTSVQASHTPNGTFIACLSDTKFERGHAEEKFTWRIEGGKARLYAYTIASPSLAP